MALPSIRSVVAYGQKNNWTPEKIAEDIHLWRKITLAEGRKLAADDPERYWKGSASVEAMAQTALTGLNEVRRQKFLAEQMPIPAERQLFQDAYNQNKGELPEGAPARWKEIEDGLVKLGEEPLFQGAKGFQGKVAQGSNDLGTYEVRQTPDGDFEALIQPAMGDKKSLIKRFKADRQEILDVASADLTRERRISQETVKVNAPLPQNEEEAANQETARRRMIEESIQPEYERVKFVETAPLPALVHEKIIDELRTDEQFLQTIPQNRTQQFTTRPARNIYASLQNAGTGVSDLVTGETSSGEAAAGRAAYIDEQSPGTMRSRFETGGHTFYDFTSQGVESLVTLYGPGTALKLTGVGGKLASAGGKAAEAFAATGEASGQIIAAGLRASPYAVSGWGNLMTTAYGANYGSILQEADALDATDPARANRMRSMAQFTALSSAVLEMLSEKVIGKQEGKVFKGDKFGLLGITMIPPTEAAEEVIGAAGQNVVGAVFDTGRDAEDLGTAAVGGLVGASPFAGLAAISSLAKSREPVIASPIKSEVGGAVLGQVPVDTPIEEIVEITDNLTEGERRRQELNALDEEVPVVEDDTSSSAAADEDSSVSIPAAPGDSSSVLTPQEQLSNEPAPGGESGVVEPSHYDQLFATYQTGETTKVRDPSIQSALPLLESGQIKSGEDLRNFIEEPTIEEVALATPEIEAPVSQISPQTSLSDNQEAQERLDAWNKTKGSNLKIVPQPRGKIGRFLNQIITDSGRVPLYVKGDSTTDGVQLGKFLVVRVNGRQALRKVLAHEFGHSFERVQGYEPVLEALKNRFKDRFADYSSRTVRAGYDQSQIESEFFADVISEALQDRSFLRSLAQETDPTVFQKILDAILTTIDRIQDSWNKAFGKERPVASTALRDLESVKAAIKELVKGAAPADSETTRESAPESTSQAPESKSVFNRVYTSVENEPVPQAALEEIADQFIPARAEKVSEESHAMETMRKLRDRNSTLQQDIAKGVRERFSERLENIDNLEEREEEVKTLRASVMQVVINNVAELAARFQRKSGIFNKRRAKKLYAMAVRTARANILYGSLDRYTAARVLRAAQMEQHGDIADLMNDYYESVGLFVKKKTGTTEAFVGKAQQAADRDVTTQASRENAAMNSTRAGRTVVKAKGKNVGLAKRLLNLFLLRESKVEDSEPSEPTPEDRLLDLAAKLETDYNKNIDGFLDLADEVLKTKEGKSLIEGLTLLQEMIQADIDIADREAKLTGQHRSLNRAAEAFINKQTGTAKNKPKSQGTQQLAEMRLAVREGRMTPEEGGDLFVASGGAETRRAAFVTALEKDASSRIQEDQMKFEREEARKRATAEKKATKESERQSRAEQKAALKADVLRSLEAADQMIQNAKAAAAEGAALQRDQQTNEEGLERWRKKQDALKARLDAAELAKDTKLAKELGDEMIQNAKDQAAENEHQQDLKEKNEAKHAEFLKQADKEAERLLKLAERIFSQGASAIVGGRKTTVEQDIMETLKDNPDWEMGDEADRRKIVEEVLTRRGFPEVLIKEGVDAAMNAFKERAFKVADKIVDQLAKGAGKGKITETQLRSAIRLALLDPTQDVATSLASKTGWRGLTEEEWTQMVEIAEKADKVQEPQARLALWKKAARIVHASGLPPSVKEYLSSSFRASAFTAASSLLLQSWTSANSLVVLPIRHALERLVKLDNPVDVFGELVSVYSKNLIPAIRSGALAFYRSAGLALPSSQEKGDVSVGVLQVEAFLRSADKALQKMKSKDVPFYQKTLAVLNWAHAHLGQLVWRLFGAWDSFNITFQKNFLEETFINMELRKAGHTPSEVFQAFMETQQGAADYGVNQLGLPRDVAAIEARYRMHLAWFEYLRNPGLGVNPTEAAKDGLNIAVSNMGNHAEVQGSITKLSSLMVKAVEVFPLGTGVLLAPVIRMPSNILETVMWGLPGYNIIRQLREEALQRKNTAANEGRFTPGRFHLTQRSARARNRIRGTVIYTNIIFGTALTAFLQGAGDDDDPETWIRYDGAAPTNPKERAEFFLSGKKEFTLTLGKKQPGEKQVQIQLTRGAFEMLNLPLLTAKHTAATIKGESPGVSAGNMLVDMTSIGLPSVIRFAEDAQTLSERNAKRTWGVFLNRLAPVLPFSGGSRSLTKAIGPPLSRDDPGYLLGQLIPATVLFTKNGLEMRNFLNENPFAEDDVFNVMSRIGFPINLISIRGVKDPLFKEEWNAMSYSPAPVESWDEFKKYYEGQTEEVLKTNKVKTERELRDLWIATRADIFKELRRKDPKPGDSAQDQRSIKEIVAAKDKDAYKKRMGTLRSMSTTQAKEKMKLVEER